MDSPSAVQGEESAMRNRGRGLFLQQEEDDARVESKA